MSEPEDKFDATVIVGEKLREVLNASGKFYVHAQEIDGGDTARLTVCYDDGRGLDDGLWFTLRAEL